MEAATVQQDPATAMGITSVTFESRGTHYRVIRDPGIVSVSPQGAVWQATEPVYLDFEPNGVLTLHVGEQPIPDGPAVIEGGSMKFDHMNRPVRETQDAIRYLLNHRDFGVQFWVQGLKPGTPLPLEQDFVKAVMDATFAVNTKTLHRLRDQELRTHGRPTLMSVVDNALVNATMQRESMGDDAPPEAEDEPIPEGNSPMDLLRRPANAAEADAHAERAAAMAEPDDPRYGGGVRPEDV
jgi:hypothetical protein